jgi:hypothetical protein
VSVGFHAYSLSHYILTMRLTSVPEYSLHVERAHFHLRDLSGRMDLDVPAVFEQPSFQRNEDLLTHQPFYDALVYFNLTLPRVPPGAYRVVATFDDGFVTQPDGRPIHIAPAASPARDYNIHSVNLYFPDIVKPTPAPGDRYLVVGQAGGRSCPEPGEVFQSRVADISDVTPEKVLAPTQRHQPGFPIQCTGSDGDMYTDILALLVDDPAVKRLRDELVGKPLWTYGRYRFICYDDQGEGALVQSHDRAPLYIARVERVTNYFIRRALGSDDADYWCGGACHEAYHVFTDDPLVVYFKPMDDKTLGAEAVPSFSVTHRWSYDGRCSQSQVTFIDTWDIERTFTTDDPRSSHPEWDPMLRAALLDYHVLPGMTKQMVAFASGFPAVFGTAEELYRLNDWPVQDAPTLHFVDDKLAAPR